MDTIEQKTDNYQFLIVEDNEFNQLVLTETLKNWNATLSIDIAENGEIAINKAGQKLYDLIFMDIQMPVMNGYDAASSIKNTLPEPFSKTPIIAITAHALKTEEEYCLKNGMEAYISKPLDTELLFGAITRILNKNSIANSPNQPVATNCIVNTKSVMEVTKGNKERLIRMVSLFLKNAPEDMKKIKELYNEKNYEALHYLMHSLKPKYIYMGMPEISEIAEQIEWNATHEKNLEETLNLINNFIVKSEMGAVELEKLLKNINTA